MIKISSIYHLLITYLLFFVNPASGDLSLRDTDLKIPLSAQHLQQRELQPRPNRPFLYQMAQPQQKANRTPLRQLRNSKNQTPKQTTVSFTLRHEPSQQHSSQQQFSFAQ